MAKFEPISKYRPLPSPERVREVFDYDAEAGELLWRRAVGPRAKAGALAGTPWPNGSRVVALDGFRLMAHRVVWCWVTGEWPENQVLHLDGDNSNNRKNNLFQSSGEWALKGRRREVLP